MTSLKVLKGVWLALFAFGISSESLSPLPQPYEAFPDHIDGPTVWKAEDYVDHPERWTHELSEGEIAELSAAADAVFASGQEVVQLTKVWHELWLPGQRSTPDIHLGSFPIAHNAQVSLSYA